MIEKIKNKECLPLGNTRYVLLEFPMSNEPRNLNYLISCLQEEGYCPIIAHPERYAWLMEAPDMVENLIRQGCLMQVNTGSITELYGKTVMKWVKKMFTDDKVHLVATDAHTDRRRSPRMQNAYECVKKWIGQPYTDLIFYKNPTNVLNNNHPKNIMSDMANCSSERVYQIENNEGFFSSFFMKLLAKRS
jgi:protein-tyrosine phosphatase